MVGLSEEQPGLDERPAADTPPGTGPERLTRAERAAALAAGTPRASPRSVAFIVAGLVALALGGLLAEHLFSNLGLNPTAEASGPTTSSTTSTVPQLHASMASFLGIVRLRPVPAPPFSLADQSGEPVSPGGFPGRSVVLTFFDARCDDICPVLAAEIRRADADLGPERDRVVFLTVDTDPAALPAAAAPAAVTSTDLLGLGNWHFLTGPLTSLDAVWRSYAVSISVFRSGATAHNDVMYFIDPEGRLRIRSTPVADESPTGAYSLPVAGIDRSALGIATYARSLLAPAP